ncbi:choline kinase [Streptomyces abyssalis]|uniref:Choline kinase n=1 Tax=Streptomyces abyssalis TaxID=933944 RepID=A0A1E7JSB5_9ACTN|nr:choline kinase family protein [Streptomyces abyssalis]OEU91785.1 choline kinase [Streptomyces abyssalis]OEU94076.1 choline kinase [Streptomyces abyssalis]
MDKQDTGIVEGLAPAEDGGLNDLLEKIPVLAGLSRRVVRLPGGLTNRNYRVVAAGVDCVVRIFGNEPELPIDRDHEFHNSRAAAEAGVGAPVIDYLPEHGMLVVGHIDGVTLSEELVRRPGNPARVAESCRRLHQGPRFAGDFDMAAVQDQYLATVRTRGFRLPEGYLANMEYVHRVRAVLDATPVTTVPCNNDLLAENFIDDGEQIRIIDYEYSGNNDPCFELGNIWSECHLSLDQLEELITAYFGRPRPGKVARAQLQGLMSKYGWTLWASIQQATSSIDFDFWSWGMEKYDSAVAICSDDRRFERLLDEAALPE